MATKAKPKPIGAAGTKPGFLKSSAEIAMEQIDREEQARARQEAKAAIDVQRNLAESAETVIVSRMALEGMAARAGLGVTWKHGEPYFIEQVPMSDLSPREREVEKRCRQLEAENQRLRDQLKSAVRRDDFFKDEVMKERLREAEEKKLREEHERKRLDQEAYADLMAGGASPKDIAALEELTGLKGVALRDSVKRPKAAAGTLSNEVSYRGQSLTQVRGQSLTEASQRIGQAAAQTMDGVIADMLAKR